MFCPGSKLFLQNSWFFLLVHWSYINESKYLSMSVIQKRRCNHLTTPFNMRQVSICSFVYYPPHFVNEKTKIDAQMSRAR